MLPTRSAPPCPTPPARRRALLLALLSVTLLVGGCSLRVTYPYLDWWLSWKLRDYITLDRDQQQHLRSTLSQFHRWHQHTQLPAYVSELEALHQRLQQPGLTPQELQAFGKQSEKHWLASVDYVLPDVAAMFMTVTEQQWQEFTQSVIAKTDEDVQPYLEASRDKRIKMRQKYMEKSVKSWLGRLSPNQRQMIHQWSAEMNDMGAIRQLEQQRWVDEADKLYRQRGELTRAEVQSGLRRLMSEEATAWMPENFERLEQNRLRTLQLLCDLHTSLSDRQRQRLLQRLSDTRQDLLFLYRKTLSE